MVFSQTPHYTNCLQTRESGLGGVPKRLPAAPFACKKHLINTLDLEIRWRSFRRLTKQGRKEKKRERERGSKEERRTVKKKKKEKKN